MEIKGIIFDLDGVLVSTDRLHYQAWKKIADKLGIAFDEKKNDRLRGVSRMESLEIVLEEYVDRACISPEEKIKLAEEKNQYYVQLLQTMGKRDVSPSVTETLHYLKNKGYLLAIGSSSKNAKLILKQTELTDWFDAISDGNNIKNSKPDPEVFLKAAQFLDLSPAQCAVVEDAEAGICAAKAGGMEAVGIGAAYQCEKADYQITTFEALKTIY